MALKLTSPVFTEGGPIPRKYTCEGEDISPPLAWAGVPHTAQSLALIVDDPDAPDPEAPRMTWVHWIAFNIPPGSSGLAENMEATALPEGLGFGVNDWNRPHYGGPCPPVGRHRYFFKLYALDKVLDGLRNPDKGQVEAAMKGHILAQATLIGTYQKGR